MTRKLLNNLTQEELKSQVDYNPESGIFTWKISSGRVKSGCVVSGLDYYGYLRISINKTRYRAHRLAWLYIHGKFPINLVDHIDGNKANNSLANLREATNQENCRNVKLSKLNTYGYKGVSKHPLVNKWQAACWIDGKSVYLGLHETPIIASKIREEFARKHFGEFYREL